mmetsp:Transcript_21568/g.54439  ORF Transcript_21568/g.54439 Transcript_21568/m.54439 type:complete len:241 (-) Transcript_21568:872-1594(-)
MPLLLPLPPRPRARKPKPSLGPRSASAPAPRSTASAGCARTLVARHCGSVQSRLTSWLTALSFPTGSRRPPRKSAASAGSRFLRRRSLCRRSEAPAFACRCAASPPAAPRADLRTDSSARCIARRRPATPPPGGWRPAKSRYRRSVPGRPSRISAFVPCTAKLHFRRGTRRTGPRPRRAPTAPTRRCSAAALGCYRSGLLAGRLPLRLGKDTRRFAGRQRAACPSSARSHPRRGGPPAPA